MTETLWHLGQAVILGLTQGLTEFMPVSSSGHLIIARNLLKLDDLGIYFDATIHLATLLALLIYFWRDWLGMIGVKMHSTSSKTTFKANRGLLWLIFIATIPGLIVGYLGNNWVNNQLRSVLMVAILMILVGASYLLFERLMKIGKSSKPLTFWSALSIGVAQALAVVPGVSRSGITMLSGMYLGLNREMAVRFSFLLAAPITAAAGGYSLYKAISEKTIGQDYLFLLMAFVAALISGFVVIHWLLKFFQNHTLNGFAYYLILAGTGLLIYWMI